MAELRITIYRRTMYIYIHERKYYIGTHNISDGGHNDRAR